MNPRRDKEKEQKFTSGAGARALRCVISEQIFPKWPESSFGRESVRELIAFIADVVSLGCRVGRCARRAAARDRGRVNSPLRPYMFTHIPLVRPSSPSTRSISMRLP